MKRDFHHRLYVGLLILFVVFLPTSKYFTSLVQILLLIHWLVRGDLSQRFKKAAAQPAVWIISLLFVGSLAGMVHTANLQYGVHDLKIKLPLLVLPFIIAGSETLSAKELKVVLLLFVAAVFVSSVVSVTALLGWLTPPVEDFREASLFISHIRFALLVDLSVFILTFYALRPGAAPIQKGICIFAAAYFISYLFLSKSMTGIVVGLFVGMLLSLRWIVKSSGLIARWFALVALLTVPVLISAYIGSKVNDFYTLKDDLTRIDNLTVNGNPYWHDTTNTMLENGHLVGLYWCEKELRESWPERSQLNYDGKDLKGQDLKYTLIRYLTSLGYRKDAYGVSRLTDADVKLIESGFANANYRSKNKFHIRMYEIIWQLDIYKKGGNPGGHSVTQRLEYLKTGWSIFIDHFWFGTGTGDVPDAFAQKYQELETQLAPEYRLRAHNQWLTFAIALGFPGFMVMLIAFLLPGILERRFGHYLFILFISVAFVSMFNEDTLETQAGVAFVAFFYPLFLFAVPHERRIR